MVKHVAGLFFNHVGEIVNKYVNIFGVFVNNYDNYSLILSPNLSPQLITMPKLTTPTEIKPKRQHVRTQPIKILLLPSGKQCRHCEFFLHRCKNGYEMDKSSISCRFHYGDGNMFSEINAKQNKVKQTKTN